MIEKIRFVVKRIWFTKKQGWKKGRSREVTGIHPGLAMAVVA